MAIDSRLRGDIVGGVTSAVITLPVALACGVLVFSPLGSGFTALGATAGLYGAIFASIAAVLFGSTPTQITGPKLSIAVILAALVSSLCRNPSFSGPAGPDASLIITIVFSAVFLSGILQLLFGLFRVGHLFKYIPYSVISGYLNGVAVLVIISQIGNFLGSDGFNLKESLFNGTLSIKPGTLFVSIVTVLVLLFGARLVPRLPASLLALVLGTGLHGLLKNFFGQSLGPHIGTIPQGLPLPTELLEIKSLAAMPNFYEYLAIIAPSVISMAVLGSLASLLGVLLVESLTNDRYNGNRELVGLGIGNLLAASFGGLVSAGSTSRTMVNLEVGGRTRASGLVHGLCLLLVVTVLGPLVGRVPLSVIAAVLMVTSCRMIQKACKELGWQKSSQGHYRQDMISNLLVMALVTVTAVFYDLIIALVAGLILASILFIAGESRRVVKRVYYGNMVHSKTIRSASYTEALKRNGAKIAVIEVEGLIFFGSTENLFQQIDSIADKSTYLVLDLRRVRRIDDNGARFFLMLNSYLRKRGKFLLISSLSKKNFWNLFAEMQIIDAIGEDNFFTDTDEALAWAEDMLLAVPVDVEKGLPEVPLEEFDVLNGFSRPQLDILREQLQRQTFKKGDFVFREGETGRSVYFLASGTVSVKILIPGEEKVKRIATFSPGVVFGELALLEGNPRSADIVADDETICYRLNVEDFQKIADEHHDIAVLLTLNIGRILSQRILTLNDELRVLE